MVKSARPIDDWRIDMRSGDVVADALFDIIERRAG